MIALAALALLVQAAGAPALAPQVSARVTPETPAIGEVITIEIRVRATAGSDIRFPALPDSLSRVEALDPRALRDASTGAMVDRTAIYRLIAFDTGQASVRIGDVFVRRGGAETRHTVTLAPIRIRSVLPTDSTGKIPRPARALLEVPTMYWRWFVALAVVLVLAVWILWSWLRSRRARADATPDAAARAHEAFAHTRALGLLEAGEPGRHALAHVGIVREYLAARFPETARSLTGAELVAGLPREFPILPERLAEIVTSVERVAFANATIAAGEAERVAIAAVTIVDDVETAWQARRARDAAEAKRIKRKRI